MKPQCIKSCTSNNTRKDLCKKKFIRREVAKKMEKAESPIKS